MHLGNRAAAGRRLAQALAAYALRSDVTMVALKPGALPIALAAARALGVAADYYAVSPILAPGSTEILLGAVATGGAVVLDERAIETRGLPAQLVQRATLRTRLVLARSRLASRAAAIEANAAGRVLVLVDEILATPVIAEAAMVALQPFHPARVIIASPVGTRESIGRLTALADEVVCVDVSEAVMSATEHYGSGTVAYEEGIERLLSESAHASGGRPQGARTDPVDVG